MMTHTRFEDKGFTLAAELRLPIGLDLAAAKARAAEFRALADLVVLADNPDGRPGLAPLFLAASLTPEWPEVVMEVNLRDRNRIAVESELLSAVEAGVKSFLISAGAFPDDQGRREAKMVHDLDPMQVVQLFSTRVSGMGITISVVENLPEMTPSFFARAKLAGAGYAVVRYPGVAVPSTRTDQNTPPLASARIEQLLGHLKLAQAHLPCLVQVTADDTGFLVTRAVRESGVAQGVYVAGPLDRERLLAFRTETQTST